VELVGFVDMKRLAIREKLLVNGKTKLLRALVILIE
jgi:hypothetical protein